MRVMLSLILLISIIWGDGLLFDSLKNSKSNKNGVEVAKIASKTQIQLAKLNMQKDLQLQKMQLQLQKMQLQLQKMQIQLQAQQAYYNAKLQKYKTQLQYKQAFFATVSRALATEQREQQAKKAYNDFCSSIVFSVSAGEYDKKYKEMCSSFTAFKRFFSNYSLASDNLKK